MKPFVSACADYHEFKDVCRHFKNAGIKLKFVEVGCYTSPLWKGPFSGYHAVFYAGSEADPEVQNLIKEWKRD